MMFNLMGNDCMIACQLYYGKLSVLENLFCCECAEKFGFKGIELL